MGAYGRVELCGNCSSRRRCHWPKQYGRALKGVQVIYGTQAHLERSPDFVGQLVTWTEAKRPLVVLDEANFIMKPFHRHISQGDLVLFLDTLKRINAARWGKSNKKWVYLTGLLLKASTEDLRWHEWRMPWFYFDWSLAVQTAGHQHHGASFRFLPFELALFGRSPLDSREKHPNGDITFATTPQVNCDFIIYSGTAHGGFSQYRLGRDLVSPFEDYRFEHPDTRWYNLASRLGTRGNFRKNSPQILDFFAGLTSRRLLEGRRPMFVAKKCFVGYCAREMEERLRALGHKQIKVITGGFTAKKLADPHTIPIINYGVIGTNQFEGFDCAYCLTGYYVNEEAVDSILQDVLASDIKVPIKIATTGRPCRRLAGTLHTDDQVYDVHNLAQLALDSQEMDTVIQAVGRVRPFTRPREVITFQCGTHPSVAYSAEFTSLGEARHRFEVPSRRENQKTSTRECVIVLKSQGLTQKDVASRLRIGLRTVKRYWNAIIGATNPNK